jgi:glycosyltransferase involved in cell wall biosynthesis
MATGLPVVAFDTTNVQENFNGGIMVTRENTAEGLAEAITTLINNPTKQAELGKSGKALVQLRFTWHQSIKQAITIYEQLGTTTKN